jgi:hypothetical protein
LGFENLHVRWDFVVEISVTNQENEVRQYSCCFF